MTNFVTKLILLLLVLLISESKLTIALSVDASKWESLREQLIQESRNEDSIQQKCSIGAVDLIFSLDGSSSIPPPDFFLAKEFIANLTLSLDIGASDTQSRVGLVLFNIDGHISFYLNTYYSNNEVYNAIINAQYPDTSDGTNIANGMNEAINFGFQNGNGARQGLPHVLVLLTDGQDNSSVSAAHQNAVNKGIVTYAVGVGPDINRNQLITATGDPSKVFIASDFNVLQDILDALCGQIASSVPPAMTTTPFNPPTSGSPGGVNTVRPCAGGPDASPTNINLDIIFAIDSSQAMGADNYETFKQHMSEIVGLLNVNQNQGSRIGLIYYANVAHMVGNLNSYQSASDAASNLRNMPYLNIIALDIKAALALAQTMFTQHGRAGRKQVLILSSTGCTNCRDNGLQLPAKATCDTIGPDQEEACRLAASMKQAGITIMTVLVQLDNDAQTPPISLASPCFSFANNANLTRNVVFGMYSVSCYCRDDHYTQFINPANKCEKFAECVLLQLTPDTWNNARDTCKSQGNFLADEFSDHKQVFLRDMAVKQLSPNPPFFWIGSNDQSGAYMWDRGTDSAVPAMPGDYTYYGPGQLNDSNGNCIAASKKVGFQLFWESRKCNDPLNSANNLYFFCQQNACALQNWLICDKK